MPALTFQPLSLRYSDPLSHSSTVSLEPHVSCSDSAHCGSTASSENGGGSVIAAGGGGGDDDDDGVVDVADVDGKSVIIVNRNNPTRLVVDVCVLVCLCGHAGLHPQQDFSLRHVMNEPVRPDAPIIFQRATSPSCVSIPSTQHRP